MDQFVLKTKRVLIDSADSSENKCSENEKLYNIPDASSSVQDLNSSTNTYSMSNSTQVSTLTSTKSISKRTFQNHWSDKFPWLLYDSSSIVNAVFCKICKEACQRKLMWIQSSSKNDLAFIETGFRNWRKALEKFTKHESSNCHRNSLSQLSAINAGINVASQLSDAKRMQTEESRIALLKILSSLRYLAVQGLPIRGHTDDKSNFHNLLHLRSEDCPVLKLWLERERKWISHDLCNEMLTLMSNSVLKQLISDIQSASYFSLINDETADISVQEQLSFCFRIVTNDLEIHELFVGFYTTGDTRAETLFNIIKDVLLRFDLKLGNCRGQCYDGASNMAGIHGGLQAKILEVEPRAQYVHCFAHSLSLVVQDTLKNVIGCRNVLNLVRDIIVYVKHSPKRLALFCQLQCDNETSVNLRPFCPTRWTVRHASLHSCLSNYSELLKFMLKQSQTDKSDAGTKAHGFFLQMNTFDFIFYLGLLTKLFGLIDSVNTAMQKKTLCFQEAVDMVSTLKHTLQDFRKDSAFEEFWRNLEQNANGLGIPEPALPRPKKIPKRIDEGSDQHTYEGPKQLYRHWYFETIDTTVNCLESRFDVKVKSFLKHCEQFIIGETSDVSVIADFYKDDIDMERLKLHRDMLLDINRAEVSSQTFRNFASVLDFLKGKNYLLTMLPELVKFVRLFLTIPTTTCTAERSFSSLRQLKSYLRSTMVQTRLNSVAILNCHRDLTNGLNLEDVADEFIMRNEIRRQTFSLKKK